MNAYLIHGTSSLVTILTTIFSDSAEHFGNFFWYQSWLGIAQCSKLLHISPGTSLYTMINLRCIFVHTKFIKVYAHTIWPHNHWFYQLIILTLFWVYKQTSVCLKTNLHNNSSIFIHSTNKQLYVGTPGHINKRYQFGSLVPRPVPSFSMLHAEKREGLVR